MKLSAILAPLLDAKADHELIRRQILAFEAEQNDALEKRRSADAERQARKRERDLSRDVTLRHSDRVLTGAGDARVEDKTSNSETKPLKKVSEAKRAFRLADDWTLPVEWRQDAIDAGLPTQFVDLEAAKLGDWSRSSKNGAKLDWRATWRNWCREAAARLPRARAGPPPAPIRDSVANAARRRLEAENGRTNEIGTDDHQQVAGLISGHAIRLVG